MTPAQVLVVIVKEHMPFRQSKKIWGTNHSAEKCFKRIRNEKEKARTVDNLDIRQMERTPRKCFICGSEDHIIAKCPKPPKENENGKSKYVLTKKAIMQATTAEITWTKIYMHLWHKCLAMTNVLVKIWWQFTIDQLDFRFRSNVPHETRSFIFHSGFIRRYG